MHNLKKNSLKLIYSKTIAVILRDYLTKLQKIVKRIKLNKISFLIEDKLFEKKI